MKRSLSLLLMTCAVSLMSCELTPSHVTGADIDDAFARRQYKTVCKGLDMADDDVRRYATTRLEEIGDEMAVEAKRAEDKILRGYCYLHYINSQS